MIDQQLLTYLEDFISEERKQRFLEIIKPNTKNWVILTTNNTVVLDGVVNSLISLPNNTSIKVFTFDKGKAFDQIDNFKLAKIGLTYVSDDSNGTYNTGSGLWIVGSLANGDTATLNITAKVNVGTSGQTITNTTTAAIGNQSDPSSTGDVLSKDIVGKVIH